MPSATAEDTVELDLTIHAQLLPAPSQRSAGNGIDSRQNLELGRVPLTNGTNCGTNVWDCTAPWVCG
jgi:hypothetical protein